MHALQLVQIILYMLPGYPAPRGHPQLRHGHHPLAVPGQRRPHGVQEPRHRPPGPRLAPAQVSAGHEGRGQVSTLCTLLSQF